MDEKFSKTVRIDLMPTPEAGSTVLARNDLLRKANYSTRQRQTEKETARVRSRYEELLESVYDAAVIASPAGKIIEVNGRAVEFLGNDRDTLCGGMGMTDVIDGADEHVMRSISETLLTERFALLQAFCKRQDGSLFPAEIAVNRLSMDNVRLCFFIRDVSVRYEMEEQLRIEHTAIQICASGIAICEVNGVLTYVNPAFAAISGDEPEALLGQDIRGVLDNAEHVESLMESALQGEQTWMSEFEVKSRDNRALFLQVATTCIRGEDGVARSFVFSLADITAHQQSKVGNQAYLDELTSRGEARSSDLLALQEHLTEQIRSLEKQLQSVQQSLDTEK